MSARIEQWVAAEHLLPEAVAAYRRAIHDSPGRVAVIDGFLRPDKLSALRGLFARDGRFEPSFGLFDRHPHEVAAEAFDAAPEAKRFYRYLTFRGPVPGRAMTPGMLHNTLFIMLSRTDAWRDWLAGILGAPLARQTALHARIMRRGMFMKRHNDDAHGILCAIFYLNTGWAPAFGGRFVQEDRGRPIVEVEPIANRLLLFSPGNGLSHGVAPFTDAVGDWERWSYSLWYGSETDGVHDR